nr:MAG TPA: hypothetical protein [Caudoviricetes sp.]
MLIPRALIRNIFSSSSVKPQSLSNCSLSSRGNCNLFFAPGVVKLFFISAVVVGLTPYVCVIKYLGGNVAEAIDTAELFYGFSHVSSVMSVYKDLLSGLVVLCGRYAQQRAKQHTHGIHGTRDLIGIRPAPHSGKGGVSNTERRETYERNPLEYIVNRVFKFEHIYTSFLHSCAFWLRCLSILLIASVTGPLHPCSLSPLRQASTPYVSNVCSSLRALISASCWFWRSTQCKPLL